MTQIQLLLSEPGFIQILKYPVSFFEIRPYGVTHCRKSLVWGFLKPEHMNPIKAPMPPQAGNIYNQVPIACPESEGTKQSRFMIEGQCPFAFCVSFGGWSNIFSKYGEYDQQDNASEKKRTCQPGY